MPFAEQDSQESQLTGALSGGLYVLFVICLSGGMMLINAFLCLTIYAAIPKPENEELSARAGQMFFFVAPVLLMLLEWNLLDRVQRLFSNRD